MGSYSGRDSRAIHDDNPSELSVIVEKIIPIGNDILLIEDSEDSNNKKCIKVSNLPTNSIQFYSNQFENSDNVDWKIGALAPKQADSNNSGLTIRRFDDTIEESIGFTLKIPIGMTKINFTIVSRAEIAPSSNKIVQLNLYKREIPDNAAPTAWSAANALSDISIPNNEFFQTDTDSKTLASLGLTTGKIYQFEFSRNTGDDDTLVEDWTLFLIDIVFS